MGEFVEFSAKTKSEAITKACIDMGVTSDQLEVQVVSEGSTGFFGIGSKPAVVRVRRIQDDATDVEFRKVVEEVSSEKIKEEEERAARQAEERALAKEKAKEAEKARLEKEKEKQKAEKARLEKEKAEKETLEQESFVEVEVEVFADGGEEIDTETVPSHKEKKEHRDRPKAEKGKNGKKSGKDRDRKPQGERKSEKRSEKAKMQLQEEESAPVPKPEQRPIKIITDPEEIAEVENRAKVFLTDVFGAMDLGEVTVTSKYDSTEGSLDVDFEGEDMGVLIGKRGQTLDSLQYLTSLVVNKNKDDYVRVKLDTEDYRRRRKETLENLARGIAYKVRKTHRPVVLEPMNPYERRIIHSALQSNKFVETMSEGEEPYRHVVVKPTKLNG